MPEPNEARAGRAACETPEALRRQLRGMDAPAILQLLSARTEAASRAGVELPLETVQTFYEVLDEIAPLKPEPYDFQASWQRFAKEHSELLPVGAVRSKDGRARPRRLKYLLSLAAAAALCVSAYARDLPAFVYLWGRDILQVSPASAEMAFESPNAEGYTSLADALQSNGIALDLPAWLPERFRLDELSVDRSTDIQYFDAVYISENETERPLFIHVLCTTPGEGIPTIAYEIDEGGKHQKFSVNGHDVYLFTNRRMTHIHWVDSVYVLDVSGPLSDREAKQILYSIGKG